MAGRVDWMWRGGLLAALVLGQGPSSSGSSGSGPSSRGSVTSDVATTRLENRPQKRLQKKTGTRTQPSAENRPVKRAPLASATLHVQVLLDRAGFSVGVIDGASGSNMRHALAAFQASRGLQATGARDAATLAALGTASGTAKQPALQAYQISEADVAGPFVARLPADLMAQGRLDSLAYATPLERLSEQFHTNEQLLRRLNPRARFAAGETIQVPAVAPTNIPTESKRRDGDGPAVQRVDRIEVTTTPASLRVLDAHGGVLFYAPVTSGSAHDPLPIGTWKVLDVYLLPKFHYNPDLFWDADPTHAKTVIPPGPNNPVGAAWIDIDKEHYGLHGTSAPASVGKSASHGCVRLTNWDVVRLTTYVRPGTRVVFRGAA